VPTDVHFEFSVKLCVGARRLLEAWLPRVRSVCALDDDTDFGAVSQRKICFGVAFYANISLDKS